MYSKTVAPKTRPRSTDRMSINKHCSPLCYRLVDKFRDTPFAGLKNLYKFPSTEEVHTP